MCSWASCPRSIYSLLKPKKRSLYDLSFWPSSTLLSNSSPFPLSLVDLHCAVSSSFWCLQTFSMKLCFINLFYLFIFGCVGSSLLPAGFSLVAASGSCSSLRCAAFLLQWLLLLLSMGSSRPGSSSCGTWAQQLWLSGSRAQAQQLWRTGLVAPRHVGSSQTRARTRVLCVGRRILDHCATREVPKLCFILWL